MVDFERWSIRGQKLPEMRNEKAKTCDDKNRALDGINHLSAMANRLNLLVRTLDLERSRTIAMEDESCMAVSIATR